jgi:hypothetical protein
MMQDPNLLLNTMHDRQRKLEREAEMARLVEEGKPKPENPTAKDRLLVAVGDALVAVGERMRTQAQSQSAVQ